MNLNEFINSIADFENIAKTSQIDVFAFYLIKVVNKQGVKASEIERCFADLDLPPYSNTRQYLRIHSKKTAKKQPKYYLKNDLYSLTPTGTKEVEILIGKPRTIRPTTELLDLTLFANTRTYIERIAFQAAAGYDLQLYDASNVMLRRLLEMLIIELFEKYNLENKIKNSNNDYVYLSDLIAALLAEKSFNLGRNTKQGLIKLKELGDLSAHSRRFNAKKSDIENLRTELRVVFEELLHLIAF